jgi:hypothetical protein
MGGSFPKRRAHASRERIEDLGERVAEVLLELVDLRLPGLQGAVIDLDNAGILVQGMRRYFARRPPDEVERFLGVVERLSPELHELLAEPDIAGALRGDDRGED